MPELSCRILRTTEELERFRPAWQALCREDPRATPFQSPEWLLPWCHQFGQPHLRALVLQRNEAPMGLVPLYIYREPGAPERRLLPLGIGTTDYLGGIYSPACSEDELDAGFNALLRDAQWDEMIVTQLRPGAPMLRAVERFPTQLSMATAELQRFETEGCRRTHATAIAELPPKIRRNAMYYRNRAQRSGHLDLTIANESNWSEAFDALVRLHRERWQSRGEPGVLADDRVVAMHREALPLLLTAGTLRLCCLRHSGQIIGVLYSLIDPPGAVERTQYFYLTAFDPAHADLRPGTVLLALAIEHAANEGVRTIDMLRGEEAYKQIWHLERTPTFGFELRPCARRDPARAVA